MTANLQGDFAQASRPARTKPKAPKPVCLRVTHDERAQLEREAGERTLSAYVRSRLFEGKRHRGPDRNPSHDTIMLARILATLGKSELASNLAAIVQAARTGTLECGPDLSAMLEQACAEIAAMRAQLISALGLKPE